MARLKKGSAAAKAAMAKLRGKGGKGKKKAVTKGKGKKNVPAKGKGKVPKGSVVVIHAGKRIVHKKK